MKIFTTRTIGILILIGISRLSIAQTIPPEVIDDYTEGVTKDFNQYMGFYTEPLFKGLGYGFNNGWYNTAKPHKSLGFDLTISFNAAFVPDADQVFTFTPSNYEVLDLASGEESTTFPTIMGGTTDEEVRAYLEKGNALSPYVQTPVLDGIKEDFPTDAIAVPSPIIQLGVGIYKGTEIKVRWVPTINVEDNLDYTYWGLGVMHSISQWIPVMKELKFLNVSGFVGFTKIEVDYDLDSGDPFDGADQNANFGVNTMTYELVGSATFTVFTGYIGLGYDNFKTNLNMNGRYDVRVPGTDTGSGNTIAEIENPVDLTTKDDGFRATVGVRLKFAIFTLHGAYTLQGYNTLNVGLGFSFR